MRRKASDRKSVCETKRLRLANSCVCFRLETCKVWFESVSVACKEMESGKKHFPCGFSGCQCMTLRQKTAIFVIN